ncbi:MAG: DUF2127 domain-containing protein [Actinomycetia bacterium]|nr:DUF2127 domain-containing protein [Actinomycetes bacterium]MCH9800264.1 DUF2127 domain-containing protein [Actinomycetes bacterium]
MKVVPRRWRLGALWCATSGHVAPGASVAGIGPTDHELALPLTDGTRLCRCLRCDDWICIADPEHPETDTLPPPSELPTPQRGKALEETVVIRGIAVIRGLHFVFFTLLAIGIVVIEWGLPGLRDEASQLLQAAGEIAAGSRPGNSLLVSGLNELSNLDASRAWLLLAVAVGYAVLEGTEAVFLWRGARWAEYLTVIATAGLLPLAIRALTEQVTVMRLFGLFLDLAILAYLVWTKRLFGVRGGTPALERSLTADTDWEKLHTTAPVLPNSQPRH